MLSNGQLNTYKDKLMQAHYEARATVLALVATIIVWAVLGFGLAGLNIQLFHTPLWVVGGTIGTWLFAIGVCVYLERRVFANIELDEEDAQTNSGAVLRVADDAEGKEAVHE